MFAEMLRQLPKGWLVSELAFQVIVMTETTNFLPCHCRGGADIFHQADHPIDPARKYC
jgi:hypothetical protein